MQLQKVSSSDIAAVGYDPVSQTLAIDFHATGRYHYFSVPPEVYVELMQTPTHGKYFYQNIKGKYAWEKADG